MAKQIKITWVKSQICAKARHRRTIKALGLKRLNHSVVKNPTPQILGMVHSIGYLIRVEEVK